MAALLCLIAVEGELGKDLWNTLALLFLKLNDAMPGSFDELGALSKTESRDH